MATTSRREFLTTVSTAGSAAGLISLASSAPLFLLESAALAAERSGEQPGERILVVIQLSGGNDGLNTVVPFADETYRRRRASLALDKNAVLKIDGSTGLHPRLTGLAALLEKGQLAIVQGVGYPNPNRSHFESMDIWHTAHRQKESQKTGWLGRSFDANPTQLAGIHDPPALHLGTETQPLALAARDVSSPSVHSLEQFRLETGGNEEQRRAIQTATAARRAEASELLRFVQTRSTAALEISSRLEAKTRTYKTPVVYPATPLAQKLRRIAQLIDAGLATRVYYVTLDGFDTHSDQAAVHGNLLEQLGGALAAFAEDLQTHAHLDRVISLVFSEFGRRVEENASRGTDHGAAAPVFLVGASVQPGLIGKQPSLADLDDGDVKFHTDFRSIYAALLEQWLGWPAAPVLGNEFRPADILRG
jgi:uncharacterized protein (DUF1501 family)